MQVTIIQLAAVSVYAAVTLFTLLMRSPEIYTVVATLYLILGLVFSVVEIKKRFTLFSFNLGFAIFLMGGFVSSWIQTGTFGFFWNSSEAVIHTCLALQLTLSTVNTISICTRKSPRVIQASRIEIETTAVSALTKQIIIALLIASFICALSVEIATTMIIRGTTYANSLSVKANLPAVITYGASYYYIALFLFWACNPSAKAFLVSATSLLFVETVILLSGERGEPISLIFTLVYYILWRNRTGIMDVVIKKRHVIIAAMLIPMMAVGLQILSDTRVNRTNNASFGENLVGFFDSQGGSVRIVANGFELRDQIDSMAGHSFVLGPIRNYVKTNVFTRLIFDKAQKNRDVSTALEGDNYIASYGYAYSPVTYLKGVGAGSTYVAEVYHDGGYLLLIIISIGIATLLTFIDLPSRRKSVIATAINMNFFRYMVLLPRGFVNAKMDLSHFR